MMMDMWLTLVRRHHGHILGPGKILHMFGSHGQGLSSPIGDLHRRVLRTQVSAAMASTMCLSSWGGSVFEWTQAPEAATLPPSGLAVDSNGVKYVCDQANNCIRIY